jgi:hypothetical protein
MGLQAYNHAMKKLICAFTCSVLVCSIYPVAAGAQSVDCLDVVDVLAIQSVKPIPADNPVAAESSHEVPILRESALPMYPPIAKAAHVTGKVIVRVTVKKGLVVKTDVLSELDPSGQRFLKIPTVENLKTWHFDAEVTSEFTVTYSYAFAGDETEGPTNPAVEMLPSLDVNITARPVKPAVMHGAQGVPAPDMPLYESSHMQAAAKQ